MKPFEIENIVFEALTNKTISGNFHGINEKNIAEYLIKPVKKRFFNALENSIEEHWVVFDENKNSTEQGYLIFYSEIDKEFGLGTKTNLMNIEQAGTFIGVYGSFLDTVKSM